MVESILQILAKTKRKSVCVHHPGRCQLLLLTLYCLCNHLYLCKPQLYFIPINHTSGLIFFFKTTKARMYYSSASRSEYILIFNIIIFKALGEKNLPSHDFFFYRKRISVSLVFCFLVKTDLLQPLIYPNRKEKTPEKEEWGLKLSRFFIRLFTSVHLSFLTIFFS